MEWTIVPKLHGRYVHDGSKTVAQEYRGHTYESKVRGAFCDKCDEAVLVYDTGKK